MVLPCSHLLTGGASPTFFSFPGCSWEFSWLFLRLFLMLFLGFPGLFLGVSGFPPPTRFLTTPQEPFSLRKLISPWAVTLHRVSGDCSPTRPNRPQPPGSKQGIPGSVSNGPGKVRRRSGRPRRWRQDMRWCNKCGESALFSIRDSHADLDHQALSQCRCVRCKTTVLASCLLFC